MKFAMVLPFLAVGGFAHAEPGGLTTFDNWIVGCDNALSCVAIGLSPEDTKTLAYLRIARDGGPGTRPIVSAAILNDSSSMGPIRLALPEGDGDLPVTTLRIEDPWAGFGSIELAAADHRPFIEALLTSAELRLTLEDLSSTVPLSNLQAALLHMDMVQGRNGTDEALVARGNQPASAIHAPPPLPKINAVKIEELATPSVRPAGLPASDALCLEGQRDYVIDTGDETQIWGVCSSGGAYNLLYDLYVVSDGPALPAEPGPSNTNFWNEPDTMLVSPVLLEDGRTIMSFDRGRGPGDCGALSYWVFDGEKLVPTHLSMMNVCQGVPPGEWPVLYRAAQSPERPAGLR